MSVGLSMHFPMSDFQLATDSKLARLRICTSRRPISRGVLYGQTGLIIGNIETAAARRTLRRV